MNYAGIALKRGLSWYDSTNVPPESSFVAEILYYVYETGPIINPLIK